VSKRLSRKEIREDPFLTAVVEGWEWIRDHQNSVFVVLIVVLVLVLGGFWLNGSRKGARMEAVGQFAEGLSSYRGGDLSTADDIFALVVERYGGFREGAWSHYFIGSIALLQGRNDDAIEAFDRYLDESRKYPFYRDAAKAGKATALENERRYEEAAELYLALATRPETNGFMNGLYLERAAENFELAQRIDKAIATYEQLLDETSGVEKRDIETKLEILRG